MKETELRWVIRNGEKVLQYRNIFSYTQAATQWPNNQSSVVVSRGMDWKDVPVVDDSAHAGDD